MSVQTKKFFSRDSRFFLLWILFYFPFSFHISSRLSGVGVWEPTGQHPWSPPTSVETKPFLLFRFFLLLFLPAFSNISNYDTNQCTAVFKSLFSHLYINLKKNHSFSCQGVRKYEAKGVRKYEAKAKSEKKCFFRDTLVLRDFFLPTSLQSCKWPTIINEHIYRFSNQCANSSIHFFYCRQVLPENYLSFHLLLILPLKSQDAAVNNWVKWKISAIAGSMQRKEFEVLFIHLASGNIVHKCCTCMFWPIEKNVYWGQGCKD